VAVNTPSFRSGDRYRPLADINVTPLVDVMLVLLIIFMVTAPLLTTGMKVTLPQAKSSQPLNPKKPIVVVIQKDGKLALGSDEVQPDQLIQLLSLRLRDDPQQLIHLRGDKDASYGQIVEVMDLLVSNGMTHLAMVTDRRPPEPARMQR
jgi:biopolymer transport protein TolR